MTTDQLGNPSSIGKSDRDWLNSLYEKRAESASCLAPNAGKDFYLCGWVLRLRDQGGCIFIDLRDKSGLVQLVFDSSVLGKSFHEAESLRSEYVIGVEGKLRTRDKDAVNPNLPTGDVEILVSRFSILNQSPTPPIGLEDHEELSEELRLRYRFLDLRRNKLKDALIFRSQMNHEIRGFLISKGFTEIETPYLNKSTPEGARDFLVPARLSSGQFYALPQSPQLFKQILMVGGMEKYFQFAKCFRDEDLRADRQPEFTQLDLEMSFINRNILVDYMEEMWQKVFRNCLGIEIPLPFPQISFQEAMEKYGTDAPDLRYDLTLTDVAEIGKQSEFSVFQQALAKPKGRLKALRVPGGASLSRKEIDDLTKWVIHDFQAKGLAWIKYETDGLRSVISKFFTPTLLEQLSKRCKMEHGDILFFGAGEEKIVHESLGALRIRMAERFRLYKKDALAPLWVFDFPLFCRESSSEGITSMHNPFTAPIQEDLPLLLSPKSSTDDLLSIRSQSYDLILNGTEIGGGSIRIHQSEVQKKVLQLIGLSKEKIDERFGFFLNTLLYGAPPHAGVAFGLDRIAMILLGRDSIRDVIAFPKTQKGHCMFSGAPSNVESEQLLELRLKSIQRSS